MNTIIQKNLPIYFELNNGLNNGGGFFSVFFFLCNAYIQSKQLGRPFYIIHRTWPYFYQRGWNDYFTTLRSVDTIEQPSKLCKHMKLDTQESFPIREYVDAIHALFVPHDFILENVDRMSKTLGDYVSIFVRRGDKITNNEAKYIHVREILKCISFDETTKFFIQTDDYTVVEEIRNELPLNEVHTLVPPSKRGSWHCKDFRVRVGKNDTLSLEEKPRHVVYEETLEMITGLLVCLRARECYTDDTSNVGRFLKLYDATKVKIYPNDYPVDMECKVHPAWTIKDDAKR